MTPLSNEHAGVSDLLVQPDMGQPRPPQDPSWMPWFEVLKAFAVWFMSFLLLAFIPVVVAFPYLFDMFRKFGPPRPEVLTSDKTFIFLSILGILPAHLLTLGVIWLFVTEGGRRPFWRTLEFEWPRNTSPVVNTLLCFLLALVLLALGWAITTVFGGNKTQLDLMVESSMAARVATALVAVGTAPIVEELIYRGVLYSAVERAAGRGIAIAIVSLLFAGVHVFQYMNNVGVILVITILSFTLTLARAYTGSLLPPFVIHLVFNGIQAVFIVLAPFIDKGLLQKGEEITPTTPGFELAGRLFEAISVYVWRMT